MRRVGDEAAGTFTPIARSPRRECLEVHVVRTGQPVEDRPHPFDLADVPISMQRRAARDALRGAAPQLLEYLDNRILDFLGRQRSLSHDPRFADVPVKDEACLDGIHRPVDPLDRMRHAVVEQVRRLKRGSTRSNKAVPAAAWSNDRAKQVTIVNDHRLPADGLPKFRVSE